MLKKEHHSEIVREVIGENPWSVVPMRRGERPPQISRWGWEVVSPPLLTRIPSRDAVCGWTNCRCNWIHVKNWSKCCKKQELEALQSCQSAISVDELLLDENPEKRLLFGGLDELIQYFIGHISTLKPDFVPKRASQRVRGLNQDSKSHSACSSILLYSCVLGAFWMVLKFDLFWAES